MSIFNKLRTAGLAPDTTAWLRYTTTLDYSPFFGIEQSDAILDSGVLERVLSLALHPALQTERNPVLAKLAEDFEEEEYCVYVPVDDPDGEPLNLFDLDEEDFEEDGETVRADRYTARVSMELIEELDLDDFLEHPAMTVIDVRSGSYDHKRKYADVTVELSLTVGQILQLPEANLSDWDVLVETALGVTELS